MKHAASLLFFLALLAAGFAPLHAATEVRTGAIVGTVLGLDGKTVAHARVILQAATGKSPQSRITDADGRFHFRGLGKGLYDLRAYSNGLWSEWHHNVLLEPNKEVEVEMVLRPKKPSKAK